MSEAGGVDMRAVEMVVLHGLEWEAIKCCFIFPTVVR